jgi:phospholipase/lecithinase/hemolysin
MEDTQMKAPALEGWSSRRLVAALLAAALLGASCGGGSDTPAESTPAVAQADPEATQAAAQLAAGGREEAMAVDATRFAPRTRQVVVFGDSLSDVGTYKVGNIALAGGGKFTTNPGPVWPETIGLLLGARVTPFRQGFGGQSQVLGGTGFAMGGSRVSQQPGINCKPHPDTEECTAALTIPITRQIDDYLGFPANGGRFTRNQLVFVFAGGNDVIFQLQELGKKDSSVTVEQALRSVQQAALDLAGQVRRILDNGATRVAVMTLPDIANSIFGRAAEQSTRDLMTAMTQTFNGTLAAALDGTRAKLIDAHAHSKDVSDNPVKYFVTELNVPACDAAKITEITQGQVTDGTSLFCSLRTLVQNDAPIRYLYADSVHPTTLGHLLFARFVLIELWRQRLL